jgi:hypothetical protein
MGGIRTAGKKWQELERRDVLGNRKGLLGD